MANLDIKIYPESVLIEKAVPVEEIDDSIRHLLDAMTETMYSSSGIGLAAPQIGQSIRAIVVDASPVVEGEKLLKLVNPVLKMTEGQSTNEEACLSLPGVAETVTRADKIVVDAYDEAGSLVHIETGTFLATVLQHEIDHLDGILFIDHVSRLKRNIIKRRLQKIAHKKQYEYKKASKVL